MIRRSFIRWAGALCLLAAAQGAAAGSFSVAPTRVELGGAVRTATVTLRNADAEPLTVQVGLVGWTQANGEDVYANTRDLLATPPVLTIPGGEERVVRIALRRDADPDKDLPYRVFFEEVPQAAPKDFKGVNIALRVGVPIFVKSFARTRADLRWELHPLADGKWRVDAINSGTAHVQVTDFELSYDNAATPLRAKLARYVLPGSRMSWTLDAPAGAGAISAVKIHAFSDRGELRADAAIVKP
ncbi:MAG: fimbria/pilus periplasmic chaperone [Steroidobacteraceae bacterium]